VSRAIGSRLGSVVVVGIAGAGPVAAPRDVPEAVAAGASG
jgi:hypothetical protein